MVYEQVGIQTEINLFVKNYEEKWFKSSEFKVNTDKISIIVRQLD